MGKIACFVLLAWCCARAGLADGCALLNNRTPVGDVRLTLPDGTGPGPCYRALLAVVQDDGSAQELAPQTNFRASPANVRSFLNPVVVPVPGQLPGAQVIVRVRVYSGEFLYAESNDFPLTLGDESAPAPLNGLASLAPPLTPGEFYTPILDPTFAPVVTRFGDVASLQFQALLGLADGKIVLAGNFTEINGQPRAQLARLLPDGAVDETFGHLLAAGSEIRFAEAQADGKIVLAGRFPQPDGQILPLIRLLANGLPDAGFATVIRGEVSALAVIPGHGIFATLGETIVTLLAFDDMGFPSSTFPAVTFVSRSARPFVQAISHSEANALWVGGANLGVNGRELGSLVRIGLDGVVDSNGPRAVGGAVRSIAGRMVAGDFAAVQGANCGKLAWIEGAQAKCGWAALNPLAPGWLPGELPEINRVASGGRVLLARSGTNRYVLYNSGVVTPVQADGPIQLAVEHAIGSDRERRSDLLIAGEFSEVPVLGRTERRLGLARLVPLEEVRSIGLNPPVFEARGAVLVQRFYGGEIEYSTDLKTWTLNPQCVFDTATAEQRFYRRKP